MKKLSILIVALLVVAGFGFAQDVTFSADATLTVGFDLDTNQFGFKNAASSALSVKWTFDDASNGGTGAFINLTKMSFEAKDDTVNIDDPTVSAGLIFDPITITIYSAPTLAFNSASGWKFIPDDPDDPRNDIDPELTAVATGDATDDVTEEGTWYLESAGDDPADRPDNAEFVGTIASGDLYFVPDGIIGEADAIGFQGLTVTADIAPISVDLMLVSDGTWVENTENAVAFGTVLTAAVDPLTIKAGVIYGPTSGAELGATASVSGAFGPASVALGFDYFEEDYDLSAMIGVDLGVASLTSDTYLTSVGGTLEMYQQVVVDASAAVDGLTFVNTTQLETILATDALEWYNGTNLAYDLGGIKPFALVELYDVGADLDMDLEAGVELTGQIELTTFTLKWAADSLIGAESLGAITFATKIKY